MKFGGWGSGLCMLRCAAIPAQAVAHRRLIQRAGGGWTLGFDVVGLGFEVWRLGFYLLLLGYGVLNLGFAIWGLGLMILGLRFEDLGLADVRA